MLKVLLLYVLRPAAIVSLILFKVLVVSLFTSMRDIAQAVAAEIDAVRLAEPDDWQR